MRELITHVGANFSGNFATVINPSTSEACAKVAYNSSEELEAKLATAARLFHDRKGWLPLHQRVEILEKAAEIMTERGEALAQDIAMEGGKPLADARVESARAVQGIKKCIESISQDQGHVIPMGAFAASAGRAAFTQKEPIGVVVAVSAFNHPLNLIVHQVGAAVATGCPVIAKPSGDTPVSCLNFVDILKEAGLPDGWAEAVITETRDQSEALVTDSRIGFFSFIGSAKVGWSLNRKLANGVRAALEHGGMAPVFVTPSADLDQAIPSIMKGAFYHAGQVCVSTQRLFVHDSIASDVIGRLTEEAKKLVVGDARDAATQVGPLIRPVECQRVADWVSEAIDEGAECVIGGAKIDDNFYQPTILVNPKASSKVSAMEIFGPVLCVYTYTDMDAALEIANDADVAFQSAIFAQNINEITAFYKGIAASAVMVNDHSAFREDGMPFAGLKSSGLGVGGMGHTIEEMQIEKMMVINQF